MKIKIKRKSRIIGPKKFVVLLSAFSLAISVVVIVFALTLNHGFAMNTISIDYEELGSEQPSEKIKVYFNKGVELDYQNGVSNFAKGHINFSKVIVEQIQKTKKNINLAVMYLEDPDIIDALIEAQKRGIVIRIITDQEKFIPLKNALANTNIEVVDNNAGQLLDGLSNQKSIMHYKFGLFDHHDKKNATLITTSANWTPKGFEINANNMVSIQDKPLVEAYLDEFEEMWAGNFNRNKDMSKHRGEIFEIDGRIVELWMSPGEDPFTSFLMRYVNLFKNAEKSIYFATFNFTLPKLSEVLSEKYQEGIDFKGVANDGSWDINGSVLFDMRGVKHYEGFAPWTKIPFEEIRHDAIEGESSLHHKYFVIDEKIVITGASNPTVSAVYTNDEDVLIIHDPHIANEYKQNFYWHFERYGGITERSKVKISHFDDQNSSITIENLSDKAIDLDGWRIVAVEGVLVPNEYFPTNEHILKNIGLIKQNEKIQINLPEKFLTLNSPEDIYPESNTKDDGEIYLYDENDLLQHVVWY